MSPTKGSATQSLFNNSGSMNSSQSSHQNNLDVPMGRQRSKSESGKRHFADFSLFPDRYDGGGMNKSATMNDGFTGRNGGGRLGVMPEPPKRSHDSNFLKKQQDFSYSLNPEKDSKGSSSSFSSTWGNRVRMSSTGDDIPRDSARYESRATCDATKKKPSMSFFDYSMFPDKMDVSKRN